MGKAKILIVEDNADNLALVRLLLERAGYDVVIALDGLEALRQAHDQLPDLILMDLAIPEIDGWDVTKSLKADPQTKDIPIMALTARTLPGDRKHAMEVGCDAFMAKPITIAAFRQEVENLLKKRETKS